MNTEFLIQDSGIIHGLSHIERSFLSPDDRFNKQDVSEKESSFLNERVNDSVRLDLLIENARNGAYLKSKGEGFKSFMEHASRELNGVDGLEKNLQIQAGDNLQNGRGHLCEILRAYRYQKEGIPVAALDKIVNIPGAGVTDIDILSKSGLWIENKHVKSTIGLDDKFRDKIDKMATAVESGFEVSGVKIKEAAFLNSGPISDAAKEYASNRGVAVQDHFKHSQVYRPSMT